MTNQHHIVPSPEQVDQWFDDAVQLNSTPKYYIARQAALWGADQELEACGRWLEDQLCMPPGLRADVITQLNGSRRPKPSSLKEQALNDLDDIPTHDDEGRQVVDLSNIRRALEALDD
jgi:hypothetical protein